MRGLLKYDAAGKPVCDLCKSFSVSQDGRSYRFELNPVEVWSDGKELEASHFADSFKRLRDRANGFAAAGDYANVAEVRADGKHAVEFKLAEPDSTLPHLLTQIASFPIRKEFVKKKDSGISLASGPVLGPYQLAAWERGKRIVIEGNPKYEGPRPVYRVDFFLGAHSQQVEKFKVGRIDILSGPTTEDLVKLQGNTLTISPYWATRSLVFNFRKGQGANAALRRAVLLALDRPALPSHLKNGERPVTGVIPPGLQGHRELALASRDLERAKAERARAGDVATSLEIKLLIRDTDDERAVAQWLGIQLEPLKIQIKTRAEAPARFFKALESGAFDAALVTWPFTIASPVDMLKAFRTGSVANRGGWTHVGYDSLVTQLVRESNEAEFAKLLDRVTQLLEIQEVAVIPLGYPTQPFLLGRRVDGFAMTPFGDPDLVRIKLKQ